MNKSALLLPFLMIFCIGVPSSTDQLPADPPAEWHVTVRVYGTTDPGDRSIQKVFVYTSGSAPASISTVRPKYDDVGKYKLDSPAYQNELEKDASIRIFQAARAVILNHRIGVAPEQKVQDGTSVEVSISSFDRSLSATFKHSGHRHSDEFKKLQELLNVLLPENLKVL